MANPNLILERRETELRRPPDFGVINGRMWADTRAGQFLLLLMAAVLLRFPVLGDWNFDIDDQFYALVGQRLLDGAVLYVDIWDRKGPGLYLIYAIIASISREPIAWQLGAMLAAAAGAYGVCRISRMLTGPTGAILAGIAYLAMLNRFGGAGGQAPVFYNPLVIFGAWSLASRVDSLRRGQIDGVILAGMTGAGSAIAVKQSAALECAFFGLFVMWHLARSDAPRLRVAVQCGLLLLGGSFASMLTFLWYWHDGHLPELWQALVTSNFSRLYTGTPDRIMRFLAILGIFGIPFATGALVFHELWRNAERRPVAAFVAMWSAASVFALAAFPNIYIHYALPLIAPLCILSAAYFEKRRIGWIAFAVAVAMSLIYGGSYNLAQRWREHQVLPRLEHYVAAVTPGRKLLVFGQPSLLYARIGAVPPSRLAFPQHFYERAEAGASGMDEVSEMRRVLAGQPETVVTVNPLRVFPLNTPNIAQVGNYVTRCLDRRTFTVYDHEGPLAVTVHSRCDR